MTSVQHYCEAAKCLEDHLEDEFIEIFDIKRLGFQIDCSEFAKNRYENDEYTLFEVACVHSCWKAVQFMLRYVDGCHVMHLDAVIFSYGNASRDISDEILRQYLKQNHGKLPTRCVVGTKQDSWEYTRTLSYFVYRDCSLELFKKAVELLDHNVNCDFQIGWHTPCVSLIAAAMTAEEKKVAGRWRPDIAKYLIDNYGDQIRLEDQIEYILENWCNNFVYFIENCLKRDNVEENFSLLECVFYMCRQKLTQLDLSAILCKSCEQLQYLERLKCLNSVDRSFISKTFFVQDDTKSKACITRLAKLVVVYGKPQFYCRLTMPYQLAEFLKEFLENTQSVRDCEMCNGAGTRKVFDCKKLDIARERFFVARKDR